MKIRPTMTLVRAARELLGWNQHDLAAAAWVGVATVRRYESGVTVQPEKIEALHAALRAAGIAFLGPDDHGTALREGVALVDLPWPPPVEPPRGVARGAKRPPARRTAKRDA